MEFGARAVLVRMKPSFILTASITIKQLGIPNTFVMTIHERPDGSLWFGSLEGLVVYRPGSHSPNVEIFSVDGQAHGQLPPDYITGYSALAFKWTANDMETLTEYISYQYKIDDGRWLQTPIQQVNTPVLSDNQHSFFYAPSTMARIQAGLLPSILRLIRSGPAC